MSVETLPPLIDIKKVKALLSVSTATIYRWIESGEFPKPIKLSANCVRWKQVDIEQWLQGRMAESA